MSLTRPRTRARVLFLVGAAFAFLFLVRPKRSVFGGFRSEGYGDESTISS